MKKVLSILLYFIFVTGSLTAQEITFRVLDANTKEPIINAHILNDQEKPLTATDIEGYFTIDVRTYHIIYIHSIGYMKTKFDLTHEEHTLMLRPAIIQMNTELLISAEADPANQINSYQSDRSHQNMDEFLSDIDGISMIQRGAYAWEPVIRGQSDQRMNLLIDGMQVFKACVDKMDPITSYVETQNLSKLQVDKSGSGVAENGNGNSTVNLITQRAQNTRFDLDAESAYRMPDQYQTYSININTADAKSRNALRFSGTYKQAGDMQAGNQTTIKNTQFEKLNLNMDYRHTLKNGSSLEASYISDKAYDVGYPALLMDATKALADIGRILWNFRDTDSRFKIQSAMIYANKIRHTMDDQNRDVAKRDVMQGMHMPMYGETTTFGSKIEGRAALFSHSFNWFLDGFTSNAYGDMKMISLDSAVQDMFIYNLHDVRTQRISLGFQHRFQLSERILLNMEESLQFKELGTQSEAHASLFEGLYNRNLTPRARLLVSASGNLLWMMNDHWSLSNSLIYSERMGNHMELFGHYIYNYSDGYFYDGNPWLHPEKTLNYDLNSTWKTDLHSFSVSVFYKRYFNYIDGIVSNDVSNNNFRFKRYANVGDVVMAGGELRTINHIRSLRIENRISYLFAENLSLDDPLPLIPPLKGKSILGIDAGNSHFTGSINWAAEQSRIAKVTSHEDLTKGYLTFDLGYTKDWLEEHLLSSLELKNITDHYYHTHTSIGNIPESGFTVMLSLRYKL